MDIRGLDFGIHPRHFIYPNVRGFLIQTSIIDLKRDH
jgi:hypothetical protein